ncbi:MAG: formate/nitrite transporter family protein [Saprospiraceae bacterium]|nr:formate/nitrite transporter family protein [Saprospiraceae bacterium]
MDPNHIISNAFPPREIARMVEDFGVVKSKTAAWTILILAILAGAFISLGSIFYLFAITGSSLGFGITRIIGGLCFSLGLILVIIAGAELFTGNNLIAMAWASGKIKTREVFRNWLLSYAGNVIGCLITVLLVYLADLGSFAQEEIRQNAYKLAEAKVNLTPTTAFFRAVLCNALVCLAVWLTLGGRSSTDKILSIVFPVTAFVTLGLEHSIANWFFLPYAFISGGNLSMDSIFSNLVFVTLGNIAGGTILVASVYWFAYLSPRQIGD